jgi:DNA-binding IclR family transcriptional regulator
MRYSVMLGAKFDFAETSSGLVLYAYAGANIRDRLDAWLIADKRGAAEIAAVGRRAAAVVSNGGEVQPSLAVSGVTNVSVPIFDHLGHAVAALTIPYMPQRAARVPLDKVHGLVREAGRKISLSLGAGARKDAPVEWARRKGT